MRKKDTIAGLMSRSLGNAVSRQLDRGSPAESVRAIAFALRFRLFPLMCNLGQHMALLQTFSRPGCEALKKRYPSIEYKYLRTYIASGLTTAEKLLTLRNHYTFVGGRVPPNFFARLFDCYTVLWDFSSDENAYGVSVSFPHALNGTTEKHDQEGDICLLFQCDGEPIFKLCFSVVPGHVFGVDAPQAIFIGCLQGGYGKALEIKSAASALCKVHPALALVHAAAAIASALGVRTLIGVSQQRQLCANDGHLHFPYDQFWEDLGGQRNAKDVYVTSLPLQPKPMEAIKKIYRQKAAKKRAFLENYSTCVRENFEAELLGRQAVERDDAALGSARVSHHLSGPISASAMGTK